MAGWLAEGLSVWLVELVLLLVGRVVVEYVVWWYVKSEETKKKNALESLE